MKSNRVQINDGDMVIVSGGGDYTIYKIVGFLQEWCEAREFNSVLIQTYSNPELKETSITVVSGISIDEAFEREVLNENS